MACHHHALKRNVDEHAYPDIFRPSAPHPYYHLSPLFKEGSLKDIHGESRSWDDLKGKSVALYFADESNRKCANFFPYLLQFYKVMNENGNTQKIEIVFVSLDKDKEAASHHRERHPWLSVDFDDPITDDFKQHFRVMNLPEIPKYGYGPRSGAPTVILIGRDGRLLQNLHSDEHGESSLLKWDFVSQRF